MSLQKETQIQFRTHKQIKEAVKKHCEHKYINMSAYITSLIVKDLKITSITKLAKAEEIAWQKEVENW